MPSAKGADHSRMKKYCLAAAVTVSLPPMLLKMSAASGTCSAISDKPIAAAVSKARASTARCSPESFAPSACAVSATVPMRKKPNSQNMQSNTSAAMATPPSNGGFAEPADGRRRDHAEKRRRDIGHHRRPGNGKDTPVVDDDRWRQIQRPRGALTSRMISQIGITITAPSRK